MIPSHLLADRANIDNLREYLTFELQRVKGERGGLEEDWQRHVKAYRAKPETRERTFPFKGAANLTIPVIATDVEVTVAGLMGALWGVPNLWSTEALRPDWIQFAARLQEFLKSVQEDELHMYGTTLEWITELVKLGTGVLKTRYVREFKRMYEFRESPEGNLAQSIRRLAANRPEVRRVALADFYIPGTAGDVQSAPWVAERLQLTSQQLESRVRAGIYLPDSLQRLNFHWRNSQPKTQYGNYQRTQEELDNFVPGFGQNHEIFEFWTNYQIDRYAEPQAVVCTIHIPTNTYLRIDFNPFFSQEYPYEAARFIRQEGRFYGIGLCEALEMFQAEVSTMHCQRIDNATIRNSVMFKAKEGSGIKTNEPVFPGRIFKVQSMDDIQPMPMGYPADSTMDDEQVTLQYARQRSGISDYQRGGIGTPAISYSTATTTVEMLRQGRLRLDQVLREIQGALGRTGQKVVELYQQFDQAGKPFMMLGQQDGQVVQEVLQFPLDILRSGVAIRVTATNAVLNKETQIRTNQIIMSMVMQTYGQMLQLAPMIGNPMVPPQQQMVAQLMIQSGMILLRRTLDAYDVQDLDRIAPDLERLLNPSPMMGGMNGGIGQGTLGGGTGMASGFAGQSPGMAPPMLGPGGPYAGNVGGLVGGGGFPPGFAVAGSL